MCEDDEGIVGEIEKDIPAGTKRYVDQALEDKMSEVHLLCDALRGHLIETMKLREKNIAYGSLRDARSSKGDLTNSKKHQRREAKAYAAAAKASVPRMPTFATLGEEHEHRPKVNKEDEMLFALVARSVSKAEVERTP